MLASRGYAAFNLAYFAEPGLPRGLVNIPLEYFENAIRWMRAQPWLRDGFLAAWGPSRGGELALLLGATFPDINAVSAWVPSGVMFWPIGLAEQGDTRPPASWTWRDKTRPPRVAPLGAEVAARAVALTQTDPPAEATHRLHMLHRRRIRYFDPGAIIAAFCSQGPGSRMSPATLPAASLTKAIRV